MTQAAACADRRFPYSEIVTFTINSESPARNQVQYRPATPQLCSEGWEGTSILHHITLPTHILFI
jgi:hypothetical protein